jgi:hypothetical protein
MAIKFATKEQRDEFLRQQYEPANQLPPPAATPSTEDNR